MPHVVSIRRGKSLTVRHGPRGLPISILLNVIVAVALLVGLRALVAPQLPRLVPLLGLDAIPRERLGLAWSSHALWPADLQANGLHRMITALVALTAAAVCVAMLNAFILLVDRGVARGRVTAIRSALGASPLRLVTKLLGEVRTLPSVALPIGLILGVVCGAAARATWAGGRLIGVGGIRAGYSLLAPLGLIAMVLLGAQLGPAVRVAWSASLGDRLRVGSRATADARAALFRNVIAVVHLTLAGALAIAGVSLSTLANTSLTPSTSLHPRPGAHANRAAFARARSAGHAARGSSDDPLVQGASHGASMLMVIRSTAPTRGAWRTLLSDIANVPGIEAESLASPGALLGLGVRDAASADCGKCMWGMGPGIVVPVQSAVADHYSVTPGFFRLTGAELLSGRFFEDSDTSGRKPVAIVNDVFAGSSFQHGNPLGRSVAVGRGLGISVTVVGVVKTTRPPVLGQDGLPRPMVFLDAEQYTPQYGSLLLYGNQEASHAVADRMKAAGFASAAPVPLATFRAQTEGALSWLEWIVSAMALLALGLATHGVHSTSVQVARRRVRELAIRRALGAGTVDIVRVVLIERLKVGLCGVAGMVLFGTFAVGLLRRAGGVPPPGIPTYAGVATLLLITAILGSVWAAREAIRVQPAELLE